MSLSTEDSLVNYSSKSDEICLLILVWMIFSRFCFTLSIFEFSTCFSNNDW